jgi:hypothetical protein
MQVQPKGWGSSLGRSSMWNPTRDTLLHAGLCAPIMLVSDRKLGALDPNG